LESINLQLRQAARIKAIESQQSFCLNSLKTSIRSQFSTLKDGSKSGIKTREDFSFE
jgi:c-di-GMP-binding flagellar brake protein YcgR